MVPSSFSRRQFLRAALTMAGGTFLAGCAGSSQALPASVSPSPTSATQPPLALPDSVQKMITQVGDMPRVPSPYQRKDWRATAQKFDQIAFDFDNTGDYLPLIWWDKTHTNMDRDGFGLYSYVGDIRQGEGSNHEGITCIAAVLGASLVGIDKSKQDGQDWVDMLEDYYNSANGQNLVLNSTSAETGKSFWYEIYPSVLYYALASLYPAKERMAEIMRSVADRWYEGCVAMGATDQTAPDFSFTAFNFTEMKTVFNGQWKEPDAAGGVGWMEYMAWILWKDPKHLQAADWCLQFLQNYEVNPFYECLLPYGAYLAVRMNAELGKQYDTGKLINWCFEGGSYIRKSWGVNSRRWGDYDCAGLVGLLSQGSGYAFAMNTFTWAAALSPVPRYDSSYARSIGLWLLNLANSARLFYPDTLPEDHQSSAFWKGDPEHVIGYEGLQETGDNGKSPYVAGDSIKNKWGKTDLGMYGSSHVGMLGGILIPTSDEKILQIDLLKTDFFHADAYPTYLLYNPYDEARAFEIDVGDKPCALYDAVTHRFINEKTVNMTTLEMPPDSALVLVITPEGGESAYQDGKLYINNIIVDFKTSSTTGSVHDIDTV
jgi:hypothetical protein